MAIELFHNVSRCSECSAFKATRCTHLADVAGCTESATSVGISADRIGCPAMPFRAYVPLTLAMTGAFVFLNGTSFGARLGSLYDWASSSTAVAASVVLQVRLISGWPGSDLSAWLPSSLQPLGLCIPVARSGCGNYRTVNALFFRGCMSILNKPVTLDETKSAILSFSKPSSFWNCFQQNASTGSVEGAAPCRRCHAAVITP